MSNLSKNGLFGKIDIDGTFDAVQKKITFDYRDPLYPPYGTPEKMTSTQEKGWAFLKKWTGFGPQIAMIAAKGAAKTHFGACFAFHQCQTYPESIGCLVSNTYGQAKDNGLPIFRKVAKQLGYETEFFKEKKIRGRPLTSCVVVYLADNVYAYMLIRSYEEIQNFEGVEIDWLWSEEGQDTEYDRFRVPYSRNRGQYADNAVFYAAMPEDGSHWQYNKLPILGMVEEEKYVEHSKEHILYTRSDEAAALGIDPVEVGIMYEFSVFENQQNVGRQYIQRNSMAYTGALYDRYVLGKRGSSRTNKMVPAYNTEIHQTGFMPKFLQGFDEHLDAWLILDFNVAPACAAVFQKKPWNDLWAYNLYFDEEGNLRASDGCPAYEEGDHVTDVNLVAAPNRNVYVQTGEIECWSGGTRGMMQMFCDKFQGYKGRLIVNGDASGNAEKSSSTTTDWDIVSNWLTDHGFNFELQRGLIVNHPDPKNLSGEIKYSNPPRRDTFNVLNGLLVDNAGLVHLVFMPESEYESGGVAASVGAMVSTPDGKWDESCDKKEGRDVARTHFTDDVRYFAYLVTGGSLLNIVSDEYEATELMVQRQLARSRMKLGGANRQTNKMGSRAPGIRTSGSGKRSSRFAI